MLEPTSVCVCLQHNFPVECWQKNYEGSLQSFLLSLVAAGKNAQSFFLCRKGTLFIECMLMNRKCIEWSLHSLKIGEFPKGTEKIRPREGKFVETPRMFQDSSDLAAGSEVFGKDYSEYNIFMLLFLGHGAKGDVLLKEDNETGVCSTNRLLENLCRNLSLKGIPKIVLPDMCRGSECTRMKLDCSVRDNAEKPQLPSLVCRLNLIQDLKGRASDVIAEKRLSGNKKEDSNIGIGKAGSFDFVRPGSLRDPALVMDRFIGFSTVPFFASYHLW